MRKRVFLVGEVWFPSAWDLVKSLRPLPWGMAVQDKTRPILGCRMYMQQETFWSSTAEQVEISVSYAKNKSIGKMIWCKQMNKKRGERIGLGIAIYISAFILLVVMLGGEWFSSSGYLWCTPLHPWASGWATGQEPFTFPSAFPAWPLPFGAALFTLLCLRRAHGPNRGEMGKATAGKQARRIRSETF